METILFKNFLISHSSHTVYFYLQALRALKHEHIVKCKEVIRTPSGKVHLVFEFLAGGNLEALTRERTTPLSEKDIITIFRQLLLALHHMHSCGYLHRDIKPENILLLSPNLRELHIKVADLGLATCIFENRTRPRTTYISTRWYRSPEILLRMGDYSFPSDMWAVGALMAELISHGTPLLPGKDERDQLARVFTLRGHPEVTGWKNGVTALKSRSIRFPKTMPIVLKSILRGVSAPIVQLIEDLLEIDPKKRPTAKEALSYPAFCPQLSTSYELTPTCKRKRREINGRGGTAGTSEVPSGDWSGSDAGRAPDIDDDFMKEDKNIISQQPQARRSGQIHEKPMVACHPPKRFRADNNGSALGMFQIPVPQDSTLRDFDYTFSHNPKKMRVPAEYFNMYPHSDHDQENA